MTDTSANRPSRKELVALGTAIVFSYVGVVISAILIWNYSVEHPLFMVFWLIGPACLILALILQARFRYRLARRLGRNAKVGAIVSVISWIVIASPTHDAKIKELMALGMFIVFSYVGAVVSFHLTDNSAQNPPFQVFYWIAGVCWFLALVLPARLGYLLAKRRGWDGVIGATLAVMPWLVITSLFILMMISYVGN